MAYEIRDAVEAVERIRELARDGQESFSSRIVLARLVEPFLQLTERMQNNATRWLTLSESMREAGRNRNYFEKKLASLGNRSRLEVWRDEDLAHKADGSVWLIHPRVVEEARREPQEGGQERAATTDVELSPEAIAKRFLGN